MDKNLFEQDFEIPEFLSRGLKSEPNLFSDESDGMSNEVIKKKRAQGNKIMMFAWFDIESDSGACGKASVLQISGVL